MWDLKHPVWDTGLSFGTRLPDSTGTIGTHADVKPGTSTMWLSRHGEAHAGHPARSPPSVMEACIIQIPPIAEEDFQILAATAYYSKKRLPGTVCWTSMHAVDLGWATKKSKSKKPFKLHQNSMIMPEPSKVWLLLVSLRPPLCCLCWASPKAQSPSGLKNTTVLRVCRPELEKIKKPSR